MFGEREGNGNHLEQALVAVAVGIDELALLHRPVLVEAHEDVAVGGTIHALPVVLVVPVAQVPASDRTRQPRLNTYIYIYIKSKYR